MTNKKVAIYIRKGRDKMNKEQTKTALINIYTDYYDGLYNDHQLKFMIKEISNNTELDFKDFADLCLDAQWSV